MLTAALTDAQQPVKKVARIGYVSQSGTPAAPGDQVEGFRRGLRDHGYVEGQNIRVEYRYIEGRLDQIPSIVSELLALGVDVLFVTPLTAVRIAKKLTQTVPIVIVATFDPVAPGIIDSLARPGGNITGLTRLTRDLSGKRLELLREAAPGISRVGILGDAEAPGPAIAFKEYETAARVLKLQIHSLEVRGPSPDWDGVFQSAADRRTDALIPVAGILLNRNSRRISELAIKNRLPSMHEIAHYVHDGGLMSYSASDFEQFRRAALYVDKILKGAKPAELPVEQPTKFEMVINLTTAKQIDLTIPPHVLARADRVIK